MLLPPSLACRYYSGKNNFHLSRHLSSHSLRVKEGKYASPLFEKVHCPHKLCSATKQLWAGPKKIRKCKSTRLSPENPAEDENCREHGVEAASLVQHLWRETSPEVSYSSSWLSSSISSSSSPLSISLYPSVNPWDTGYTDPSLKQEYSPHVSRLSAEPHSPEVHTDLDSHVAYTSHSDVTVYSSWKIQFGLSLLILTASLLDPFGQKLMCR